MSVCAVHGKSHWAIQKEHTINNVCICSPLVTPHLRLWLSRRKFSRAHCKSHSAIFIRFIIQLNRYNYILSDLMKCFDATRVGGFGRPGCDFRSSVSTCNGQIDSNENIYRPSVALEALNHLLIRRARVPSGCRCLCCRSQHTRRRLLITLFKLNGQKSSKWDNIIFSRSVRIQHLTTQFREPYLRAGDELERATP